MSRKKRTITTLAVPMVALATVVRGTYVYLADFSKKVHEEEDLDALRSSLRP